MGSKIQLYKRACKHFSNKNGQFLYKRQRVVVMAKQQQLERIKDVHESVAQSTHSKAIAFNKGRDSAHSKISEHFVWYSIYKDVKSYIRSCENCEKQGDLKLKTNSKLHSMPVPWNVMRQAGVDLCGLPEVDHLTISVSGQRQSQ